MPEFIKLKGDGRETKAAVEHWQSLAQEAPGFYLDVAEDVAQFFLQELRQAARAAGPEWAALADEIQIGHSPKGIGFALPYEAHDLEYGHPDAGVTAKPVVRQTVSRQGQGAVKSRFNNIAHERMAL